MISYRVIFSPEGRADLQDLRNYVFQISSSRRVAAKYIARLKKFCQGLSTAPHRGEQRFESKTGLRTIGFERSISVVFRVIEKRQVVEIVGIYDHGRNPEFAQQRDF